MLQLISLFLSLPPHSCHDQRGLLAERSRASLRSDQDGNEEGLNAAEGETQREVSKTSGGTDRLSIFLQTANHLLDAHALKFAEMCLAHELASLTAGPASSHAYLMAEASLHMHRQKYEEAITCIKQALVVDIQVCNVCTYHSTCIPAIHWNPV